MAIWPAPMIYAGPTEVQFHAKSRRVGGASFFTVGRDPAGMPYSSGPLEGEDLYHPDHGRYALTSSPGVGNMEFLGFDEVYYDKKEHTMRGKVALAPHPQRHTRNATPAAPHRLRTDARVCRL